MASAVFVLLFALLMRDVDLESMGFGTFSIRWVWRGLMDERSLTEIFEGTR